MFWTKIRSAASFLVLLIGISIATPIRAQIRPIHIFMIGDSTMADKKPETEPERGWGQLLQSLFGDTVNVSNHAVNGRSSKSFMDEGLWKAVLDSLQPGDYVIVQFGHNDEKPDAPRHTDPYTTYRNNLEKFIKDTRDKGAFPILCTSIVRRKFDDKGALIETHGQYPDATRQAAKDLKVPLLDLELRTKKLISELGPEKSKSLFLHTSPGAYPNRPNGVQDDTHLNIEGATEVARMAINEMQSIELPLSKHLKK
jgi:lysophospholipase L1-like esterase